MKKINKRIEKIKNIKNKKPIYITLLVIYTLIICLLSGFVESTKKEKIKHLASLKKEIENKHKLEKELKELQRIKLLKETFVGISKIKTNDNKYFFKRYLYNDFQITIYDLNNRLDFYDSKNDRLLKNIKLTKQDLEKEKVDKVFECANNNKN